MTKKEEAHSAGGGSEQADKEYPQAGSDNCTQCQWPEIFFYNCVGAFLEIVQQGADNGKATGTEYRRYAQEQ